jgi:hypothetical protein
MLFFLKFQIFGSGFVIAQTNRLCLNGKILKKHIKNLDGTTVTFGEKKSEK